MALTAQKSVRLHFLDNGQRINIFSPLAPLDRATAKCWNEKLFEHVKNFLVFLYLDSLLKPFRNAWAPREAGLRDLFSVLAAQKSVRLHFLDNGQRINIFSPLGPL